VRGRLDARPRARVGRGVDIVGDPEALHHGDHGSVSGRALLTAPRRARRARKAPRRPRADARRRDPRSAPPGSAT
jgi:hypothetical protein